MEDISDLPLPENCPQFIGWPLVPMPVSCDDPYCHGISSGPSPYRCRQPGGIVHGVSVFGCPCCPRLIDCEDPRCDGLASEEVCQTDLLKLCVCVSANRRVQANSNPQVEEDILGDDWVVLEDQSLNNQMEALDIATCPSKPPVRCIDRQCRGQDDWKAESDMSLTPRCNRAEGTLYIEGTRTPLHGCPCCPEYIACSSTDCNGNANQACTSTPLHGCFCDWPGRIMIQYVQEQWQPHTDDLIQIDTFDQMFYDPDFDPDQFMAEEYIPLPPPHLSTTSDQQTLQQQYDGAPVQMLNPMNQLAQAALQEMRANQMAQSVNLRQHFQQPEQVPSNTDGMHVFINNIDVQFDDPDYYDPLYDLVPFSSAAPFSTTLSASVHTSIRASPTSMTTAAPSPQNTTQVNALLSQRDAVGRQLSSGELAMFDHTKQR